MADVAGLTTSTLYRGMRGHRVRGLA